MVGIIVADPNEINEFPFELKETKEVNQFTFFVFEKFVAVHSGIGIANAAACAQELISTFDVELIVNYGAVGANAELDIYDVVVPEKIFYHDVTTPWYKRGQTPGEDEFFQQRNEIKLDFEYKTNNLASGSSFISDEALVNEVSAELGVSMFDMETAAIAQIAHKNVVQLLVIKCVSDAIGVTQTNIENINDRIKNAGKKAFDLVVEQVIPQF